MSKVAEIFPQVVRKPWGGNRLQEILQLEEADGPPIGEAWQISIHPDAPSRMAGGLLSDVVSSEQMPYLAKLIDTGDNLSLQVHPGDEYAMKHENSSGKSECWIILAAEKGAGVFLGLKSGVDKEMLSKAINSNKDLSSFLVFRPVLPGDFFFVPSGTAHAIGKGILLAEVQQSSGITYRVWDWNRTDKQGNPRQLHIEKAMDVISFAAKDNSGDHFSIKKDLFSCPGKVELARHPSFNLDLYNLSKQESLDLSLPSSKRVHSLLALQGRATMEEDKTELFAYKSYLITGDNVAMVAAEDFSVLHIY